MRHKRLRHELPHVCRRGHGQHSTLYMEEQLPGADPRAPGGHAPQYLHLSRLAVGRTVVGATSAVAAAEDVACSTSATTVTISINIWQPTGKGHARREERQTATNCGHVFLPLAPKGGESLC
jgi:hypothetical protein